MEIGINQIKNGLTLELDNVVYTVVSNEPVKPGKGSAFCRTKLKNMKTGATIDRTFRDRDKLEVAFVEKKNIQYLYSSKDSYEFMDHDTYDQMTLNKEDLGGLTDYLKENLEVTAVIYKNKVIALEPPIFIDFKIVATEPGIKGDTSKSGTKPARIETGKTVLVPLFINEGDVVRVDTRTGGYMGRA